MFINLEKAFAIFKQIFLCNKKLFLKDLICQITLNQKNARYLLALLDTIKAIKVQKIELIKMKNQ